MRLDLLKNYFIISSFFFNISNRFKEKKRILSENKKWMSIYVLLYLVNWWFSSELFIGVGIYK